MRLASKQGADKGVSSASLADLRQNAYLSDGTSEGDMSAGEETELNVSKDFSAGELSDSGMQRPTADNLQARAAQAGGSTSSSKEPREVPVKSAFEKDTFVPQPGKYYTAMVIVGGFTVDSIRLENDVLGLKTKTFP